MAKKYLFAGFLFLFFVFSSFYVAAVSTYTVQSLDNCGGFCVSNSSFDDTLTLSQGATIINATLTLTTDMNIDYFNVLTTTSPEIQDIFIVSSKTLFFDNFMNKSGFWVYQRSASWDNDVRTYFFNESSNSFEVDNSINTSVFGDHCDVDSLNFTSTYGMHQGSSDCLKHYVYNLTGDGKHVIFTRNSSWYWDDSSESFLENLSYRDGFFNSSVYSFGCTTQNISWSGSGSPNIFPPPYCFGSYYNADDNFTQVAYRWSGGSWTSAITLNNMPTDYAIFDVVDGDVDAPIHIWTYQLTGSETGFPYRDTFSFKDYHWFRKGFPYDGNWVLANNSYYTVDDQILSYVKRGLHFNATGNDTWFRENDGTGTSNAESYVYDYARNINITVGGNVVEFISKVSQSGGTTQLTVDSFKTVYLDSDSRLNESFISSNTANISFDFYGGYVEISDINITYTLADGGVINITSPSQFTGSYSSGSDVSYVVSITNNGDYALSNFSVDTLSNFGIPVYKGLVTSNCTGLNLSINDSISCSVLFSNVTSDPEFDEKLQFVAFGTPSNGLIYSNYIEIDFSIATPSTPPAGGGGGGSTTIIDSDKRDCNITVQPSTIVISRVDSVEELKFRNDDSFTYSPEFGFGVSNGNVQIATAVDDNGLYVTNPVLSVLQGQVAVVGIGYRNGFSVVQGTAVLILSSGSCTDIEIPIVVDFERGESFLDLFSSDVSIIDFILEPIFDTSSKSYVDYSFFSIGLLFIIVIGVFSSLIFGRQLSAAFKKKTSTGLGLLFFYFLFSVFVTFFIVALIKGV